MTTRTNKVTVPGPYVPKSDGGVYFQFPHGADTLVALCNQSDPDRVASMLNFALTQGFEMEMAADHTRLAPKAAKGNGKAAKPRTRTASIDMDAQPNAERPCSWCGGVQKSSGKAGKEYCGPCARAYSNAYGISFRKACGEGTDKGARAKAEAAGPAQLRRWRNVAIRGAAFAREVSIKERGLKILRRHRSLLEQE